MPGKHADPIAFHVDWTWDCPTFDSPNSGADANYLSDTDYAAANRGDDHFGWSWFGSKHRDEPAHRASGYWVGPLWYDTSRGSYLDLDWRIDLGRSADYREATEE